VQLLAVEAVLRGCLPRLPSLLPAVPVSYLLKRSLVCHCPFIWQEFDIIQTPKTVLKSDPQVLCLKIPGKSKKTIIYSLEIKLEKPLGSFRKQRR
jgi:hypothetical protein